MQLRVLKINSERLRSIKIIFFVNDFNNFLSRSKEKYLTGFLPLVCTVH